VELNDEPLAHHEHALRFAPEPLKQSTAGCSGQLARIGVTEDGVGALALLRAVHRYPQGGIRNMANWVLPSSWRQNYSCSRLGNACNRLRTIAHNPLIR
jgi:hypothetical protein